MVDTFTMVYIFTMVYGLMCVWIFKFTQTVLYFPSLPTSQSFSLSLSLSHLNITFSQSIDVKL